MVHQPRRLGAAAVGAAIGPRSQHRHGVAIVAVLTLAAVPRAVVGAARHLGRGAKVVVEGLQELAEARERGGHDGKVHDDLRHDRGVCQGEHDRATVVAGGVAQEEQAVADGDGDEELRRKGHDNDELGLKGQVETEDEREGKPGDEELKDEAKGLDDEPTWKLDDEC